MTSPQSLFVISSRSAFVTEARQAASRSGVILIAGRAELGHGGTAPAALDALRSDAAGALLLDLDSDIAEALRFLQEACRTVPDARVLAASSNRSPDLILSAMRAGAADFLPLPLEGDALKEALSRAMRRGAHESQASQRRARVLSFMSVKGGCGATTLAVNLAVSLSAASGRSAVLVDLDYPGGDVTAMLKMAPAYSLADVAANIHRLDMDLLNSMTMRHESGLRCLAAVTEGEGPSRGIPPSPDQLAAIVRFLADHFDDVILAGGALGESELAALNQAHMVHLVTTLDFLSLRRAQALIGRLREFGVTGDALRVIVNRVDRGADLTLSDARQALDAPVVWSVPDDPATAERAINEGVPLVSKGRSRLQAAFEEYAKALSVGEKAHAVGGLTGLFRRLVPARA